MSLKWLTKKFNPFHVLIFPPRINKSIIFFRNYGSRGDSGNIYIFKLNYFRKFRKSYVPALQRAGRSSPRTASCAMNGGDRSGAAHSFSSTCGSLPGLMRKRRIGSLRSASRYAEAATRISSTAMPASKCRFMTSPQVRESVI